MGVLQHRMSKKIAQLTKVIYHLNNKNEDHTYDLHELSEQYESEIETVRNGSSFLPTPLWRIYTPSVYTAALFLWAALPASSAPLLGLRVVGGGGISRWMCSSSHSSSPQLVW